VDRYVIVLVCVAAGACIQAIEEEAITAGRVTRDCVVPAPEGVTGLGGPVSIELSDASLWIWPLVATADGGLVENASALVRDASELCAGGPELARGPDGRPATLLALSTGERALNAARTDGKQLWLEPTGGFSDAGTAYVFYRFQDGERLRGGAMLGTGLCVIRPGVESCERLATADGYLLWPSDERVLDGGFVADGRALVYGCRRVAALSRICTVTGVPLELVGDPAAYQVYNIFEGWVDELANASVVADELGAVTVSPYLDGLVLTTLDLFEQRVLVRRGASFAEFGGRTDLFGIARTEATFPSGGRAHVGLSRNEHELHVSYAVERADEVELHLATYLFDRDWTATP
jgi:hypothetical protein